MADLPRTFIERELDILSGTFASRAGRITTRADAATPDGRGSAARAPAAPDGHGPPAPRGRLLGWLAGRRDGVRPRLARPRPARAAAARLTP